MDAARNFDALAEDLAAARIEGTVVDAPGFEFSVDEGYAIQDRVSALLESAPVGWKVGSTSVEAQARLGTDEPGAGRLIERYAYRSGERVPVAVAHHPHVEVEFGLTIGRDLPPRAAPYSAEEVLAAVSAFVPALEIVGCRCESGLGGSGRALLTADGGASIAFVGGDARAIAAAPDLPAQRCTLDVNGERRAEGTGARALGSPLRVLAWLANHLSRRSRTLEAGAVVITGTCTGLVPVKPGDHVRGDFDGLGTVEATMTALEPEGRRRE